MIRVLIVDDNDMYAQTLVRLLEHQPDMEVVGWARSLAEAREKLSGINAAIINRGLQDGDGLGLIGELRRVSPGAGVLVMSLSLEHAHSGKALEAGADEILDKLASSEGMVNTIRRVAGG